VFIILKIWFNASYDYLSKRWRQQLNIDGDKIMFHSQLSPFETSVGLWRYVFWSHYV
jgi:hypothetical protein